MASPRSSSGCACFFGDVAIRPSNRSEPPMCQCGAKSSSIWRLMARSTFWISSSAILLKLTTEMSMERPPPFSFSPGNRPRVGEGTRDVYFGSRNLARRLRWIRRMRGGRWPSSARDLWRIVPRTEISRGSCRGTRRHHAEVRTEQLHGREQDEAHRSERAELPLLHRGRDPAQGLPSPGQADDPGDETAAEDV